MKKGIILTLTALITLAMIPQPQINHFPKADKQHIQKQLDNILVADRFDEANHEINKQIQTYQWQLGLKYDLWGYKIA